MKAAIRRQDRDLPGIDTIGQITTIFDLLPGPPEVQRRKLELLAQIRKLTHDPALVVLNEKEKADLAKIDPSPDLHELTPMDVAGDRAPAVHGGRRLGRQGGAGLPARPKRVGVERPRSAEDRLGPADDQARQRQGDRDVGLRGRVRSDDPFDPSRRSDRHRRVVDRGADHHRVHDPSSRRGADGAGDAGPRRVVDDGRRRAGEGPRDLPELHRAADHVRHRGGIRPERGDALPRGARRIAGRGLDRRGGRALLRGRRSSATARCWRPATRRSTASA